MRLRLDENLGARVAELLREAGHDTATVPDQQMCSVGDVELITACRTEHRCLVTLDLDFANPLVFPPSRYPGIAVLRLPPKPTPDDVIESARTFIIALSNYEIAGKLWVVQRGRIREYRPEDD